MNIHAPLVIAGLFGTGLITGLYSSVVGGGALLLVPVFTLVGVPLAGAIGSMRVSSVITQAVTVLAFWRKGGVRWRLALGVGLCCIPGAYLGARLVLAFNERLLTYVVALLMLGMLLCSFRIGHHHTVARKKKVVRVDHGLLLALSGVVLSVYGGFYGAGFSTVFMFLYIFFSKSSVFESSGNASVATVIMASAASVPFLMAHEVDWALVVPIASGGAVGSWVGVGLAAKYGLPWIRPLLSAVVVASIVRLLCFPG